MLFSSLHMCTACLQKHMDEHVYAYTKLSVYTWDYF